MSNLEDGHFSCPGNRPGSECDTVVSAEAHDWFVAKLNRIAERATLSLDVDL